MSSSMWQMRRVIKQVEFHLQARPDETAEELLYLREILKKKSEESKATRRSNNEQI